MTHSEKVRFARLAWAPAALGTALALLVWSTPVQAQKVDKQSKGVVVENDASQPVPTAPQGVTPVEGSVSARQEGAWAVGVDGSVQAEQKGDWSVAVEGPVLAQQEGEWSIAQQPGGPAEPFQSTATVQFEAGRREAFGNISIPLPRRFVVEHVSAHVILPGGQGVQEMRLDALDAAGGTQRAHYLVVHPQASIMGAADFFAASQAMRIYAVGTLRAATFRTADSGIGTVRVTVSGYLVDP